MVEKQTTYEAPICPPPALRHPYFSFPPPPLLFGTLPIALRRGFGERELNACARLVFPSPLLRLVSAPVPALIKVPHRLRVRLHLLWSRFFLRVSVLGGST